MALTSFIMFDLCSTFLALAWPGTLPYPDKIEERLIDDAERTEWIRKLRAETDNPSNFIACQVSANMGAVFRVWDSAGNSHVWSEMRQDLVMAEVERNDETGMDLKRRRMQRYGQCAVDTEV